MTHASTHIIVFTDDDCTMPCDWLVRIGEVFEVMEHVAVLFGNVVAAPHDTTQGFIPAYVRQEPFLAFDSSA